ncbi:MAG: penicillin-binding protein 1C [Bacteroidia bacterium]|nr:penicillin-binding protein 1C [Bacteroidia bacterium]NNM24075.1 penicillin-binding protein 1C [Flavobacteriaceae bacterium]
MGFGKQHIKLRLKRHKIKLTLIFALFVLWIFCLPSPLFDEPSSTVVESREGELLGARIADDGQWRFPKMDSVPYRFEQALLFFEDEHFHGHPGFNPVSMGKAIWANLTTKKRRGGSTLTQQVIRLSRKNRDRTYTEKLVELFMATRLEAGFSKKEILSLYATHAPFGGNVVGLETASWRYFGIPANELSWGQSAALAILPNAPALIFPGKNEGLLRAKRDRLLYKLYRKGIIDSLTYQLAIEEQLPGKPHGLPQLAPHLAEKIKREHPGKRVVTTIDANLQRNVNAIVREHHRVLSQNEIYNVAVLLLDIETRDVVAYVGNSPASNEHDPYVNIIHRPRSTGSILKPFLYTAALDGGELLPNMLLTDVPTVINGYHPQNFNKQFHGAVPASEALSRSLNIPAVRLLRSYGLQRFHNRLQEMNIKQLDKPANYYGLSLILGGGEGSLWEITKAYAGLASTLNYFNASSSAYREHEYVEPNYLHRATISFGKEQNRPSVFDAGSIYATLEAMQNVNRPEGELNWNYFSSSQQIAWKTGTSFGFKDAWAVGVTPKYAIGVWVGNADGEGRPGLTGIQAAAPVLFDVLSLLPSTDWFAIPFDEMEEAELCERSGHLASVYCSETVSQFIPKNGIKTAPCPYHQQVFLAMDEAFRVNSSCYELSEMEQKTWFALPPLQEYYYAAMHPEYRPLPPFREDCLRDGESLMEFIFPKPNETILLARDFDMQAGEVVIQLAHRDPATKVYWYLDDTYLGMTETFHQLPLHPLPGKYLLTAVDEKGNEIKRRIQIEKAS